MPPIRISQPDDARLALFAGVRDPDLLRRHRLFAAEGRLVVQRLLNDARYRPHSLLLNDASFAALEPDLGRLAPEVPIYIADSRAFETITGFNLHRGSVALAERPRPSLPADVIRGARLVVVLEGVTDADNVGGVFRNAAAFGAGAVLLSATCCDPFYRKSIRTSMGATLRVPFARMLHWERGLRLLRDEGFSLVALTPAPEAMTLAAFCSSPQPQRIALLVGTEGRGLTPATLAVSDVRVRIPMSAAVDSLNLATAAGIALSRLDEARAIAP